MTFGERLRDLRTNRKMSQKDLAVRISIAKSAISFYESDERFPSYEMLIKIARIFNVTTDYLLGIERNRLLDVSGLSEKEIAVISEVIDAFRENINQ